MNSIERVSERRSGRLITRWSVPFTLTRANYRYSVEVYGIPKFLDSAGNRNMVAWSAVSHRHRHECHYSRTLNNCTWLCTTSNSLTVRAKCDITWLRVTATQSSPTISSSSIEKQINKIHWHIMSPNYDKTPTHIANVQKICINPLFDQDIICVVCT